MRTDFKHPTFRNIGGLALALLVAIPGCFHSREYYRVQADQDSYHLISENTLDPRWQLERISIQPNPTSRMYDPYSPDCPPMPTDDPASHQYMEVVDGKAAYWGWEKDGVIRGSENPSWMAYVPVNDRGEVELSVDRSVELARLHSPDYQVELEDLYLTALDVSFERFRFDAQFFGGYEVFYTADGPVRGGGDSRSVLDADTRTMQMEKLFATGGELIVGFANTMMWEFSGPNQHTVNSLVDFSLVQPLLRTGGRKVVLENLTQQERDLLAAVRDMARFNQSFYLDIVAGRGLNSGPRRGGGFPSVGPSGSFGAGGYFGLLQRQQTIRNQESNIASLRSSLAQLEAFFEAGRIDSFQVELTRQSLFQTQSSLLNNKTQLANSLDRFKIDLGLPPDLEVKLGHDPFFDQFNLLDPAFTPVTNRLSNIQLAVGESIVEVLPDPENLDPLVPFPDKLSWDEDLQSRISDLREKNAELTQILNLVREEFIPLVKKDVARLEEVLPERIADLKTIQEKLAGYDEKVPAESVSEGVLSTRRLQELPAQLRQIMEELEARFENHAKTLDSLDTTLSDIVVNGPNMPPEQLMQKTRATALETMPDEITILISDVLGLSLVQARARADSIALVPVDITSDVALDVARINRLDWMNAQAAYVDSWRDVQIVANDLLSDLDIVFEGDMGTVGGDNPVKFDADNGRLRVGLQWDAPITRLVERNDYREAQIAYQQTRRAYYRFQDEVNRGLRDTIRTIDLNRINFELRRAAVQVAISQVERTQLRLQEPAKPNQNSQQFNSNTARDLLNALDSLLSAQNDFLSVGVSYEVLRRSLDIDMGTVQLDDRGLWIDPGEIDGEYWEKQLQNSDIPPIDASEEIPYPNTEEFDATEVSTPIQLFPAELEAAQVVGPEKL